MQVSQKMKTNKIFLRSRHKQQMLNNFLQDCQQGDIPREEVHIVALVGVTYLTTSCTSARHLSSLKKITIQIKGVHSLSTRDNKRNYMRK